jgi:hypothetical protein
MLTPFEPSVIEDRNIKIWIRLLRSKVWKGSCLKTTEKSCLIFTLCHPFFRSFCSFSIQVETDIRQVYRQINRLLQTYKDEKRGPTFVAIQSPQRKFKHLTNSR